MMNFFPIGPKNMTANMPTITAMCFTSRYFYADAAEPSPYLCGPADQVLDAESGRQVPQAPQQVSGRGACKVLLY